MRVQDLIVRQTQRVLDDVIRSIEALPEEKRDWKPEESARSAMDQLREIAWTPTFYMTLLQPEQGGWGADHDAIKSQAQQAMSLEDGADMARRATGELCNFISAFPDDRLDEDVNLPFGGGMVLTMAEVLGIHYWNLVYHHGQISYIQTLLGDREMH